MKQLITFFLLAYLISWIIWLPLYGHVFGIYNLYQIPYQHAWGSLGPFVSSIITTFIYLKRNGVKQLLHKLILFKPFYLLIIVLISPFTLALLASMLNHYSSLSIINAFTNITEFPEFSFIQYFLYNLVFFGIGEEMGWRGFALPRIQSGTNALTASTLITCLWALWHLPLFFYRQGYMDMNIAAITGWFFSLLTGSILLTWLYNSSRGSILICALFHSSVDIAFTADFHSENIINYMGFMITVWGIMTIIIFKAKDLSRIKRQSVSDN